MGPTNVALVKLYQANQKMREAQGRLDAVSKNVRVQQRKVHDLSEKLRLSQQKLKEKQVQQSEIELDIRTRDARIERLRTQQQTANNNKEYQAFLIEINTEKVDKAKSEEQLLQTMEAVETLQNEVKELTSGVEAETQKLTTMQSEIGGRVEALQAEVDALRPRREAAAAEVPARARDPFERLAERYEGEALSAVFKPSYRREEYACTVCNMDLVTDIYNKLHTRDDLVYCPSCGRMLYIPDDLPPELAVGRQKPADSSGSGTTTKRKNAKAAAPRKTTHSRTGYHTGNQWSELLRKAQGESVKGAMDADQSPIECEVTIDGKAQGFYKGKSVENLERVIKFHIQEQGLTGAVFVTERLHDDAASPPEDAGQSPE